MVTRVKKDGIPTPNRLRGYAIISKYQCKQLLSNGLVNNLKDGCDYLEWGICLYGHVYGNDELYGRG